MVPRDSVNEESWLMLMHYANDRQGFNGMVYIEHFAVPVRSDGSSRFLDDRSGISFSEERFSSIDNPIDPVIKLYGNGLMQISWDEIKRERVVLPSEPGSFTVRYDEESARESNPTDLWFRYLWCGNDGIILIDENEQHYFYQVHSLDFDKGKLADSLGDNIVFEDLSDIEVKQLIEEHSNVLESLLEAFTDAGIEVNIDTMTGRVSLDNSFLFGVNEHELTVDGASYLDSFLDVYAEVILNDAFTDSIAEIIVEGHTCSDGSRELNQRLSENRAAAVAEYCLSRQPELAEIMVTRGLAFDYPVLDASGNEDKPASRRVVFRFILSTGT
jgi:outer membrane protein OmpA-like peptidoglycan-associated protein